MKFGEVKSGEQFTHMGKGFYRKTTEFRLNRYGYVNAIGPKMYDGDTGHRYFYPDQIVEVIAN